MCAQCIIHKFYYMPYIHHCIIMDFEYVNKHLLTHMK